jgi:hypothetical protein
MTELCRWVLLLTSGLFINRVQAEGTLGEFHAVSSSEIPEVLTTVSAQVRANYERIKTWQGEMDVIMNYLYSGAEAERVFKSWTDGVGEIPKVIESHKVSAIEFAVDIEKGFLYVNNCGKSQQYTDIETARNLGAKGTPGRRKVIVQPEYYLECRPSRMRQDVVTEQQVIKQARENRSTHDSPVVFDPRSVFRVSQPVWETFPRILQYIKEHGEYGIDGYTLSVEKRTDGTVTEYRLRQPGKLSGEPGKLSPENYLFITSTFSSAKGFNIISEEIGSPDGSTTTLKTWGYQLVDGVYLPIETTEQAFAKNGELRYEEKSLFKNQRINHSIPPETFSYKNLGLQNGDSFIDKIASKQYTYKDGELVETAAQK